jgi:hypothetical protein
VRQAQHATVKRSIDQEDRTVFGEVAVVPRERHQLLSGGRDQAAAGIAQQADRPHEFDLIVCGEPLYPLVRL